MTEQSFRTIGALAGLAAGVGLMIAFGYRGVMPSAIFGATGCVLGAMAAERIHRSLHRGE